MVLNFNTKRKSFLVSVLILFGLCLGYYINVLFKTDYHYIYFLDDAYIHLAMAKNFAMHHVWGVTSHEFSSSSSSPLFTGLLSGFIWLLGNNDQFPLYINLVFGVGIIYFLNAYFSEYFKETKNIVIAVLFTIFFAVLHLLLLSGMEHLFHVLLITINILCLTKINYNKSTVFGFYFTIVLMGLVRFESMFYFVILAFCFLLQSKWKTAFFVISAGLIPVAIFCYFNYQQDGYLFPNSVVVKGTKLDFTSGFLIQFKNIFLNNLILNISFYKVGIFPIIMCLVFIFKDIKKYNFSKVIENNFLLIVISLLMICHSLFAELKGGFRYEAYILTGFSMALIPKMKFFFEDFKNSIKNKKLLSVLGLANCLLLLYKFGIAHLALNNGGKNIYEQQVQSAKFLNTYYNTSKIVANDIGAITYYTDIQLLDIAGLASTELISLNENKAEFDDRFETFMTQYTLKNKYDLAIVYEVWLGGYVPKGWKKVAVLKIQNKISVAQDEVTIYCISSEKLNSLRENIKNFKWHRNVQVKMIQ